VPAPEAQAHPGQWLNLPASGAGSVASMGARVAAFLIDLVLSFGVAFLLTRPELPKNWSLVVWAVMTVIAVGSFGFTPGQAIVGIRVASIRMKSIVGLWAVPRTLLTFVIVPSLILDADGRGLHDRICRTVVIRTRGR